MLRACWRSYFCLETFLLSKHFDSDASIQKHIINYRNVYILKITINNEKIIEKSDSAYEFITLLYVAQEL